MAILACVAAAMSVHGDMRKWQKVLWMLLIGALLVVELRAISHDRAETDAKSLAAAGEQQQQFKTIRDIQAGEFRTTAGGLETAIQGIQSTLKAANRTIEQTRPYAAVRFDRFEFSGGSPSEIKANTSYMFNLYYVNIGPATATDVVVLPRIYLGKPEDLKDQAQMVKKFNDLWDEQRKKVSLQSVLVPSFPT